MLGVVWFGRNRENFVVCLETQHVLLRHQHAIYLVEREAALGAADGGVLEDDSLLADLQRVGDEEAVGFDGEVHGLALGRDEKCRQTDDPRDDQRGVARHRDPDQLWIGGFTPHCKHRQRQTQKGGKEPDEEENHREVFVERGHHTGENQDQS